MAKYNEFDWIFDMRNLDAIDKKILHELARDARQSNATLSEKVGLSASQCWQRIRKLEGDGVITGYHARVERAVLGIPETVFVEIKLHHHDNYRLEDVCEKLALLPEVLDVHITSGEFDCLIKVAVSGTSGYQDFLKNKLYTIPGVSNSRSAFSLRCFKRNAPYVPD